MSRNVAPALWPALALLLGIRLGGVLVSPSVLPWLALLALALTWGRAPGRWLACLALGTLCGLVERDRLERGLQQLRTDRMVEVVGRCAAHPRRDEDGWLVRLEILRLKQRRKTIEWPEEIWLRLPPGERAPGFGATIRVRGHLRRSAGYANRARIRPGPWRMRLKSWKLLHIESRGAPWERLASALQGAAERALDLETGRETPPRPGLALVRALVLGERNALPKAWQQGLKRAGLGHLAAVSGLHVGLLLALVWGLSGLLPRTLRLLLALVALGAYLLLIGPHPSILRAALMAAVCTLALWTERPPAALNALACCAAAMALADPAVIDRLGFRLSVSATAGILLLTPRLERGLAGLPLVLRRSLSVSLAAQLATLPWILPLLGGWHPSSLVLNLIAVPWLAVVLASAFPFLLLAFVAPGLARLLLPWLDLLAAPIAGFSALPASGAWYLPWATWPGCAGLAGLALLTCYGLRSGVEDDRQPGCPARAGRALRVALLSGALLAAAAGWIDRPQTGGGRNATAEVVLLDVGQGDAILLRDGSRSLLIDGGGWPHGDFGGRVLLPALAAEGIRRLDAVLMTHPDRDHCGGLEDLLRYLPVAELWSGPGWHEDCARQLLSLTPAPWRPLWRGQELRFGQWRLDVLHPAPGERRGRNDRSVVIMARWRGVRLLLTGDIEAATERRLLRRYRDHLHADLLKVAHHGSKTSTSAAFLAAVRPRLALISAGVANPYRHPAPAVLQRLEGAAVRVLRSDLGGAVHLSLSAPDRVRIALPASPR